MTAKLETVGGCKILRVGGRIDFESALDFEQRINSMIQEEGDCFIIELSEVELLSSAGLRGRAPGNHSRFFGGHPNLPPDEFAVARA